MSISKPIFIIIACIVLVMIFGGGLIWPKYQELQSVNDEIVFKTQELNSKEAYFSNLAQVAEKLNEYKEKISKMDSALPKDPSIPSFLNFLQESCSQNGMLLNAIGETSVSSKEGKTKEISVSIQVQGSYVSFKNFLSFLERSSRMVETENISFSSPRDEKGQTMFSLIIKTHSY